MNTDVLIELVFEDRDYSKTINKLMKNHPSLVLGIENKLSRDYSKKVDSISELAVEVNKKVTNRIYQLNYKRKVLVRAKEVNILLQEIEHLEYYLEYGNETLNYIPVLIKIYPDIKEEIHQSILKKISQGYTCIYEDPFIVPENWTART